MKKLLTIYNETDTPKMKRFLIFLVLAVGVLSIFGIIFGIQTMGAVPFIITIAVTSVFIYMITLLDC